MEQQWACGQPMVISKMTLGQFPVNLLERHKLAYEITDTMRADIKEHVLNLYRRVWFWDMFSKKRDLEKALGRTLTKEYLESK